MYISSFRIDGFGLFSNAEVTCLPPGLAIFMGRNEAGKSTCLEFLRAMLTDYVSKNSRDWRDFTPMAPGRAGGSLVLQCQWPNGKNEEMRLCRRPGPGGMGIYSSDGVKLPDETLARILCGVNAEVYRKVFGFSLSELERFESLNADEVRNALYGASFGPGLASPAETLRALAKRKEEIFKRGGSAPALNADMARLEDLRSRIAELSSASSAYDALLQDLNRKRERLAAIRDDKNALENGRRLLERRLGVWRQWDQWRLLRGRLEAMPRTNEDFPENAEARLARLQADRDACERQLAARKEKVQRLREKRETLRPDSGLLGALPDLRRLAERKSSYRQAISQIIGQEETCGRAREDLARGLTQLGPGWDCERIRSIDRSLFAREGLERQAREMNAAVAARKAAIDYLGKANREVESCETEVAKAEHALEVLPQPSAALDERERDELRQNMARLEESRRLEPGRERAVEAARGAFHRALEQARMAQPETGADEDGGAAACKALDALLARQNDALDLAQEMRGLLDECAEAARNVRQAEENAENVKLRIEDLRLRQRSMQGPGREALDARAVALRSLRSVATNINAERERLRELDSRINSEEKPARIKNWTLLVLGIMFLVAAVAVFSASLFWEITELNLGEGMVVPVNRWAAYGALFCGVALLAGAFPGNGAEQKRRRLEMAQLQSRRETCAMHLAELGAQSQQLCRNAGVDSMDAITLDATEMLLEREKEQCFHEERSRKDMEGLKNELAQAQAQIVKLQSVAQKEDAKVQQCRRRWHALLQSLGVDMVPSPESAATFFARAEAARMAYENVSIAQKELDALGEDLRLLEESIASQPAIARRLESSSESLSLENAVRLTLEACREADLAREERIRATSVLQNLRNELARAQNRQEEASAQLESASQCEEGARKNWSQCLGGLGLGEDLDPETVREAFKYMENCLAAEDSLFKAQSELARQKAEMAALEGPLAEILDRCNRKAALDPDNVPDWLLTLDELLAEAEENANIQKERARIEANLSEEENDLGAEEAAFSTAGAKVTALLEQAGVDDEEVFLRMAREHAERLELKRRVNDLELAMKGAAEKQPFERFIASFEEDSRQGQEEKLGELNRKLDAVKDEENDLANAVGMLNANVQALAGAGDLAALRQEEAMLLESMRGKALRWSVLALAESLLEKAKLIFERERQPEVIRMASEIFRKITNGRWERISSSLEDQNLVILPPGGEPVAPENLSRGAQEQAYLALRLAYICNHAQHAAPLPVIMDEILVNFDPERAERAARAIADMAKGDGRFAQQVLYFTCQPHMVEIFKSVCSEAPVFTVENGSISIAAV